MKKTRENLTLEHIYRRAEWDGNCLVWTGVTTDRRFPMMRIDGQIRPVRRVLYELIHEHEIRKGFQISVSCETDLCIHPDCLIARQRCMIQKGVKASLESRIKNSMTRRKMSKLDIETVREIRTSNESGPVIEARLGLSHSYAARIRRGDAWIDFASPFAQLGARP